MKKIIRFYFLYELLKESINPRIAPRARHISKFSWGWTPNVGKERLLPINIHTIKFRTPDLQIQYTPML